MRHSTLRQQRTVGDRILTCHEDPSRGNDLSVTAFLLWQATRGSVLTRLLRSALLSDGSQERNLHDGWVH